MSLAPKLPEGSNGGGGDKACSQTSSAEKSRQSHAGKQVARGKITSTDPRGRSRSRQMHVEACSCSAQDLIEEAEEAGRLHGTQRACPPGAAAPP